MSAAPRVAIPAGHYQRGLQTQAGEVLLRVPKLRRQTFETAIIEGYRRRESSVEEALIEMYLAGCPCAKSKTIEGDHPYVYLDVIVPTNSDVN